MAKLCKAIPRYGQVTKIIFKLWLSLAKFCKEMTKYGQYGMLDYEICDPILQSFTSFGDIFQVLHSKNIFLLQYVFLRLKKNITFSNADMYKGSKIWGKYPSVKEPVIRQF